MVEINFCTSGDVLNYIPFAKEMSYLKNSYFSNVFFFFVDVDRYCITGMFNGSNYMCSAKRQIAERVKVVMQLPL